MLSIGDKAPHFELPVTMEETWKLSDNLRKENIVLLFFPLAFSPPCHDEMCSIRDGFNEFRNLSATVIGISVDSPFVLNKWKPRPTARSTRSWDRSRVWRSDLHSSSTVRGLYSTNL